MNALFDRDFIWGVGIEDTFIPQTRPGLRALDEYELTGHYKFWRQDFDLMKEVGVDFVRWGVPWYRLNPAPGKFDWQWMDEALDYMVNVTGVFPIIDLMHYGAPLWLENTFINAAYPQRVAEYAYTFADRYKDLVRYYTPLNEPMINAEFCGRRGEWPPYLQGDDGYVKVLMAVTKGVALTGEALRAANPQSILIQVEALEWHWSADERLQRHVQTQQAHIFLPFDLFSGGVGSNHPLLHFLRQHGVEDADLQWLREHALVADAIGMNFYPVSGGEWSLGADGSPQFVRGVGFTEMKEVLQATWQRYRLPILLTETGLLGSIPERKAWMDGSIAVLRQGRAEGIPILGYTWWPLFDMIDWSYRLGNKPLRQYLIPGGLWASKFRTLETLRRQRTGLATHFRQYIQEKR